MPLRPRFIHGYVVGDVCHLKQSQFQSVLRSQGTMKETKRDDKGYNRLVGMARDGGRSTSATGMLFSSTESFVVLLYPFDESQMAPRP